MKTTSRCVVSLTVLLATSSTFADVRGEKPGQQEVSLCEALEGIGPGQRQTVCVSGVYVVEYEASVFYSSNQRTCPTNVQPATWVEFAEGMGKHEALDRTLRRSSRALVTFKGELFGPPAVGPDDVSQPLFVAYANRARAGGYGHLNAFRTKLVVQEVLAVNEVPRAVPREAVWVPEPDPQLEVLQAEVPRYPEMAQAAGISGTVIVEVTVKNGQIVKIERKSGDRMLARGAIANIETWRFKPGTDAVFNTTFVYALERRKAGDRSARVELQLPESVRITGASRDW